MFRTFRLRHDSSSAALARRHVEQFATEHLLDHHTPIMAIIASELVTNAIQHGSSPVDLTLGCEPHEVRIEVTDGDPSVTNVFIRTANEASIGGRGLLIVASLADHWGTKPTRNGKTVWATINPAHA